MDEPDPSTEPLLTLLVEPAVKVPACVLRLLARRELSWNPQVLKLESFTVTVTGMAAPPGVYDAGSPEIVALPVPVLPLWQEAQTLAVGDDELKEPAPPGKAETVGTCNCIPNMIKATKIPVNSKRTGARKLFNGSTP